MTKIAVITPKPTKMNMSRTFGLELDQYSLTSQNVKRVLVKDVDIDIDVHDYDWVILIGAEPLKYFSSATSVTDCTGMRVDAKPKKDWSDYEGFLASINPAAMHFKPEIKPVFEFTVEKLMSHIDGTFKEPEPCDYKIWEDSACTFALNGYLKSVLNDDSVKTIALDSETGALYCRKGEMLGVSMSHKERQGIYAHIDAFDDMTCFLLQKLADSDKHIVFHNTKFDEHWFRMHLNVTFDQAYREGRMHDSMVQHYVLDERPGHGLKPLAIKYTDMGNYDKELDEFKKAYCKSHKIKQADFTYDLIPFELLSQYAVRDTDATIRLHNKFYPLVAKNPKLKELYDRLLMPAVRFLGRMEDRGVPVSKNRLRAAQKELHQKVFEAEQELYAHEAVVKFEAQEGKKFNPQSPIQMRTLLFDIAGYTPTGKLTDTGQISCDAEVLQQLAEFGDLPILLLKIRKNTKLLSSFINKMIDHVDYDGRVRTGFNLTTVTSGRLSSSGTINLQQLPRDNPIVKGCITAPAGYKVVANDLTTAEVYYAAVLSGDPALQQVFINMREDPERYADFHSTIAHMVFNLPCEPNEVKKLYPAMRQASKAITFGILYGSGPASVRDSINEALLEQHIETGVPYEPCDVDDAKGYIATYFGRFPVLKKWIDKSHEQIRQHGFIYSHYGRKRRLHNVKSDDRGVIAGEIRSGFNAIIQSASSDSLLIGCIDTDRELEERGLDAEIVALVHDSIVAIVREDLVDEYNEILYRNIQQDRINAQGDYLGIRGTPIGIDSDSEDGGSRDYGCGKLKKMFPHIAVIDDPEFANECLDKFDELEDFPMPREELELYAAA
ncbi:DNA polymerase [Vibrio phage VCPH]|nr:DNA polymerase [Vibrio phage VCPH]